MSKLRKDALEYHRLDGKPGKISVQPTKPLESQRDLSLAYSPGVAEPVLEIEKDPAKAFEYTSRGNLVGVISNGYCHPRIGEPRCPGFKASDGRQRCALQEVR